jgi:thiol:disulfide interchange protein
MTGLFLSKLSSGCVYHGRSELIRAVAVSIFVVKFLSAISGAGVAQRVSSDGLLDSVTTNANIYHSNADANKEIREALIRATTEHKRVLLVFGANWCYDCHVLDHALHEGEAGKIMTEKFLLVHVDISEGEKNAELVKEYKIPLDKGVPAVAILEAGGKLLYSSGEGEFEAARRMLKKDLLVFLKRWSLKERG